MEDMLNFSEKTRYSDCQRFKWKQRQTNLHNIHLKFVYDLCNEKAAPIGIDEAHGEAENRNLIKRFDHR